MERYGVDNPACTQWVDGCQTCQRDDAGKGHCSMPGIACLPGTIVCNAVKWEPKRPPPDAAPAPDAKPDAASAPKQNE